MNHAKPAHENFKTRTSKATGNPLRYRLAIFLHNAKPELKAGQIQHQAIYLYDFYEKTETPNLNYYEKIISGFFGTAERKPAQADQLLRYAAIFQNWGHQHPLREWHYQDLLREVTIPRIILQNCEESKQVIRRYWVGMHKHPHSAYHIATALHCCLTQANWSESRHPEVHSFFVKAIASLELEVAKWQE